MAYQFNLITGLSGALVTRDLSISGALASQMASTVHPASQVTGNFTLSGYETRYVWSGAATAWTGTLANPAVISGSEIMVKNVATGAPLFLTGIVDYSLNYTVTPRSAVRLWSDGRSWIVC